MDKKGQAQKEYLETADRYTSGKASREELEEASKFLDTILEEPNRLPEYTDSDIDGVIRHRCCARCYGQLAKYPAPGRNWFAVCPSCGYVWNGATVSKLTVVTAEQQARVEYFEVRFNKALQDCLPPRKPLSEKEIMESLGY